MKLYVAARYEDIRDARAIASALRGAGHEVLASWLRGDPANTYDAMTPTTKADEARRDLAEIDACAGFVKYQSDARTTTGGAHFETGYAVAKGKRVFVVGEAGNVFHHLPDVAVFPSVVPLIEFLAATRGAAPWHPAVAPSPQPGVDASAETILQEAQRLVHGNRGADYGHPLDDFARTAKMWSGLFRDLLRPGVEFEAPHVGMGMVCVKLSREMNKPKRDNMTDGAGYCETVQMCREEIARRADAGR